MNPITKLALLPGFLAFVEPGFAGAQDTGEKKGPVTMSMALKLGPEDLTRYTDPSEAGQDNAALLYANAKRVETEYALAQRDVALVNKLQFWRVTLRKCRNGSCSLAYTVNGGGTMYSHGQARDCAPLEDFLSGLAKRLPLKAGKGDPGAAKQVDDAIAFLKKLRPLEGGDAKSTKAAKAGLAAGVSKAVANWMELKGMIGELPPDEANRIALFAVESLGWLKEGEQ